MTYLIFLACMALTVASGGDNKENRGIGHYPGDPAENFSPTLTWAATTDGTLTNVALHRAAYASSARDYNHTAHLVTDGICDTRQPVTLTVSTPAGPLPRREAEWAIDGGPYSRNILLGSPTFLQYDWDGGMNIAARSVTVTGMMAYDDQVATQGYALSCQTSEDGVTWQTVGSLRGKGLPGTPLHYKLHSDPNKQEAQDYLPARVLNEEIRFDRPVQTAHLRVLLEMDGAAHWDIRELLFKDARNDAVELLPSQQFTSLWMSNGGRQQWLYADLGQRLPIEQVRLHWCQAPRRGQIQVSDDAQTWTTVADIATERVKAEGRYVRLLLQEPGDAGYYALREMEILSPRQVVYTPHTVAGVRQGRYELSGGGWLLQRASEVTATGEQIASADFDARNWVVATVPGTVLSSYINIGAVPNPNYADDVDQISESFFRSNFWYRDEFEVVQLPEGQVQWLHFDGINWKANVFLNGQRLGRIEGAFMRGRFNVTGLLRKGRNYLAVEICCNEHFAAVKEKDEKTTQYNGGILGADNPTFHAAVGWDWITTVRGRQAGIWNEVYLTATGPVTVSDPYVQTTLLDDGKTASVRPSVFLRNNTGEAVRGILSGYIGDVRFEQTVTLPALTEQEVTFAPEQFPQLTGSGFRLWWPNGYGEPYLYDAGYTFTPLNSPLGPQGRLTPQEPSTLNPQPSTLNPQLTYRAGLREMRYEGIGDSLRIYVNGRRFIPLGGNWGFDEHNLLYRSREYDIAVGYHRDMHFTMIRNWVGQIGDEAFYEACDRHGIMIWQDFWLANPADGPDPYDDQLFLAVAHDYTRRMRSHASIGLYCGRNEGFPPEGLDRKLRQYVHQLAPGMEYISHSSRQGVSGEGPYRALPAREYFLNQSGKIHSERGMPNVMNIESLQRTIAPDALWPQSRQWGQHDYTLEGAQRASDFNRLVETGFGQSATAEEFCRRAQLINYNGYRAMFESTSRSRAGLLLWMTHPCWPSMVWQTYDYYFDPTAAYFGCKKACEPLHIQYNALTDSIEIVNHSAGDQTALTAVATVFDLNGKRVGQQRARLASTDDSTVAWLKLSTMGKTGNERKEQKRALASFLRLQLYKGKDIISENLYIMGCEEKSSTEGLPQGDGNQGLPQGEDYRALLSLPAPQLQQQVKVSGQQATVTLRNTGKTPAVFLRLNLKGTDGQQILPATYSDNYLTLMPGEQRTVTITWQQQDARGQQPVVEVTHL